MKFKLYLFLVFSLSQIQLQGQSISDSLFSTRFSSKQFLEDIDILEKGLKKLHPSLYEYISKDTLDNLFNETKVEIRKGANYAEFYKKISSIIAQIKCQHTIATPESRVLNEIIKEGKFFPLWLRWEFEPLNAFIGSDLSADANLPPGIRIISINDQPIQDIYSSLISYFPSDGDILTNKHSRLEMGVDFQFWYYLLIDRPQTFVVKMKTVDGNIIEKTLKAVTFTEWSRNHKKYRKSKNPVIKNYMKYHISVDKKNNKNPIRYEIVSEDIALLNIRSFDSNKFKEIISQFFKEFNTQKIGHLIIDVRNNGGGSDIYGRHLFNYFTDKPTVYFDSLYTSTGLSDTAFLYEHTDKNKEWYEQNQQLVDKMPDGRFATKPEVNQGLLIQEPNDIHFTGEVYILMNGRSASTTAEFTSAMHINNLATFIGEESGGDYHGGNGGDFVNLKLPNSKIEINIPLVKYVMNSRESKYIGRGTLPDFKVRNNMQDYLDLRDAQLEFVLDLIHEKSKK